MEDCGRHQQSSCCPTAPLVLDERVAARDHGPGVPVLDNAKHERFAQALARGATADEAYVEAGYSANRGNATRMKANESILERARELQAKGADLTLVTIQSLTDELEEARLGAATAGQHAAAVSATMGKAKLHGLLIDKKQVAGPRGGPLQVVDVTRLKGMTTQELEVLERALIQIGLVDGDQDGEGEPED